MWDGGGVWRMWDGGGVWRMWDGGGVWRMWDGGGHGGRWRVHVCGYRGHMVEGMCEVHVGGVRKCMGDMWKCVCVWRCDGHGEFV